MLKTEKYGLETDTEKKLATVTLKEMADAFIQKNPALGASVDDYFEVYRKLKQEKFIASQRGVEPMMKPQEKNKMESETFENFEPDKKKTGSDRRDKGTLENTSLASPKSGPKSDPKYINIPSKNNHKLLGKIRTF